MLQVHSCAGHVHSESGTLAFVHVRSMFTVSVACSVYVQDVLTVSVACLFMSRVCSQ